MTYYTHRHSCYLLQYHLVLITKYRHPVIKGEQEQFLKEYTQQYFKEQNCSLLQMDCNEDHIHILFECSPNIKLSDFVNAYKSASSRQVRKRFSEELSQYYWKPYYWSNSYFITTVSENTTSVVAEYIKNQKQQ